MLSGIKLLFTRDIQINHIKIIPIFHINLTNVYYAQASLIRFTHIFSLYLFHLLQKYKSTKLNVKN